MLRWLRRIITTVVLLALALGGLAAALGYTLSGPKYAGPPTDHFDGQRFHNMRESEHEGLTDVLRWQLKRERGPWSERSQAPGPRPPARVERGALRVTFINHAT